MCLIYFSKDISFKKFYSLRLMRLAPAYVTAVFLYSVSKYFDGMHEYLLMVFICCVAYIFSKN